MEGSKDDPVNEYDILHAENGSKIIYSIMARQKSLFFVIFKEIIFFEFSI